MPRGDTRIFSSMFKHRLVDTTLKVSDLVDLVFGPQICISTKFPDDADTAGSGTMVWEAER